MVIFLIKKLWILALLPFICFAQSWQLSVVEKGVVNGVHIMSIEPPFADDLSAYHFAISRPCPDDEAICAVIFVRPDAPLPPYIPIPRDYYPQVMAYKLDTSDWRAEAYRCLFLTLSGKSYFPCLGFHQLNNDVRDWQACKLVPPHPTMAETWYLSHPSKRS